ncbi:hypothetical protein [Sporomusa aerivorans]|uniref:hypothetical protein n=1 Tax=Sporomusa aerivorans TaxID=204936 RepID=UPI00352A8838
MRVTKCFFSIILFLLICFPVTGLSAPPSQRYENIMVDDTVVALFDKETLRYEKDPYRDELLINVWIKTLSTNGDNSYNLSHYLFRLHNSEILSLDSLDYDATGQLSRKITSSYDPNKWVPILPETVSEQWYISVTEYAKVNAAKLKKEYNERMGINEKNRRNVFSFITDFFDM